jgi:hypothetical protein
MDAAAAVGNRKIWATEKGVLPVTVAEADLDTLGTSAANDFAITPAREVSTSRWAVLRPFSDALTHAAPHS